MTRRVRGWIGSGLATMGGVTLCVELGRYWLIGHAIHPWPVALGCILGFVGFYILDPKGASDGGDFLVTSAVRLLGVIRTGRRSTDVAVVVEKKPEDEGVL